MSIIDRFLSGDLNFREFERIFKRAYVDELPSGAIDDERRDFFAQAQERLEWTAVSPSDADRRYGWVDRDEYAGWLRRECDDYRQRFSS